ncbi:MAG: hypothetical protein Q9219_003472 [cf. Caloplaca sp. 3 TL-2023]
MPIVGDLSMDANRYGEYAPPIQWDGTRTSLDIIDERMRNFPSWTGHLEVYTSGLVSVSFGSYDVPSVVVSATAAARLVMTTKNIFFGYEDNPRAFIAEIKIRRKRRMLYDLSWRPRASTWPERLPFLPPNLQKPDVYIYLYGRDAEPSLVNLLRDSRRWLINALDAEGPRSGFINRDSCSHNSLRLIVEGPGSAESTVRMKRRDIIVVVNAAYEHYMDHGPREFAAKIFGPHLILGKRSFSCSRIWIAAEQFQLSQSHDNMQGFVKTFGHMGMQEAFSLRRYHDSILKKTKIRIRRVLGSLLDL